MVLFKIWLKDFEVTILVKTLHIIQKNVPLIMFCLFLCVSCLNKGYTS